MYHVCKRGEREREGLTFAESVHSLSSEEQQVERVDESRVSDENLARLYLKDDMMECHQHTHTDNISILVEHSTYKTCSNNRYPSSDQ